MSLSFYDTFARVTADLGVSDSGHTWDVNPSFSVDGTSADLVLSSSAFSRAGLTAVSEADVDVTCKLHVPTEPEGATAYFSVLARWSTGSTNTGGSIGLAPDGTTSVHFHNNEVITETGAVADWAGKATVQFRYRIVGTSARAKVWFDDELEPANWSLSATVVSTNSAGKVGIAVSSSGTLTNFPYTLSMYSMTAQTVVLGTTLSDSFTRSISNSLGASDSDHPYTVISGSDSKLSVNGTQGVFTLTDDGIPVVVGTPISLTDMRATLKTSISPVSSNDDSYVAVVARWTNSSNYIVFRVSYPTGDPPNCSIHKVVAGVSTAIGLVELASGAPGDWWNVVAEIVGSKIRMKVWEVATSEPTPWTIEEVDTDLPEPGLVGLQSGRGVAPGGSVNLIDDFTVRDVVPALTAEFVDNLESPSIRLTLTNGDVYHLIRVSRLHLDNTFPADTVRGWDGVNIPSATATSMDYEIPLDEDFNYRVDALDSDLNVVSTAFSDPVSIPVPYHRVFIRSIGQPTLSQRVQIVEFPSFNQQLRVLQEAKVLGRSKPVVLFDVMDAMTGSFRVMSTLDQDDPIGWDLRKLLREGQPLLFQSVSRVTGIEDFYFVAESFEAVRKETVNSDREPRYLYEIQFKEVDRPPTDSESLGFFSWQTILDAGHPDWQSVKDTFSSWLEVLNFTNRTPL